MPNSRSSRRVKKPSIADGVDIRAICHGTQSLPKSLTYQEMKALLAKANMSDKEIQNIVLKNFSSPSDAVLNSGLLRALLEAFKGLIPKAVVRYCVDLAHESCMKKFPHDGEQTAEQTVLYLKLKAQRTGENNPLIKLLVFVFNSIINQYGYVQPNCEKTKGQRMFLHQLEPHGQMVQYLNYFMYWLVHRDMDVEILEKVREMPILCGMATLECARVLTSLGAPFQIVDFQRGEQGHSIILIGGPDDPQEKMKVLLSGANDHDVIVMNPYRREILEGRKASIYFLSHVVGSTYSVKVDSRLPNFRVICHARAQLEGLLFSLLDAYFQGSRAMRQLLLTQAKKWLKNTVICRLHVQHKLTPTITDLKRAMELFDRNIDTTLLDGDALASAISLAGGAGFFPVPLAGAANDGSTAGLTKRRAAGAHVAGGGAATTATIDVMVQQGGISLTLKLACIFLFFILTALLLQLARANHAEVDYMPSP